MLIHSWLFITARVCGKVMFSYCLCVSVCLSVCLGYNFWMPWHRNFIFGMVVHLDNIWVKFEYQGHWIKVKVTLIKLASWTVGHQICLLWPAYGTDVIKVKVISWSRSFQGHSHFKVKVILESNGNVFRFISQSGWFAFVRMLILLV